MDNLLANNRPVIGGARPASGSGGTVAHVNPATGKPQAEVIVCGAAEIDRAVEAASAGQRAWLAMPGEARRDALLRLADLIEAEGEALNLLAALECGTPKSLGAGGPLAQSWIRYYAGWADKIEGTVTRPIGAPGLAYTLHEPIGIVGVIIPWNSPIVAIAMTAVLALAAGNAVILKPPTQTPFVAIRYGELALQAGIPEGVLNIVPGDAEAGEALVRHPRVGKISFTGGESVARIVMHQAADALKPVALELGGKNANIVFPDADLDKAAQMSAIGGLMVLSGQGCVLPTRVYAHSQIFDDFVERLSRVARTFVMGDPLADETVIGPVINASAASRIEGIIECARREAGGTLVMGGGRAGGDLAGGFYIEPTIFADIDNDSNLAREEVFGPVLAVMRFDGEDEVVAKANDTRFGLGAYVHTNDLGRAHRMAATLEAGAIGINGMLPMAPNLPFGGYKQSGIGREGGRPGLEEFMQLKQVMLHI